MNFEVSTFKQLKQPNVIISVVGLQKLDSDFDSRLSYLGVY